MRLVGTVLRDAIDLVCGLTAAFGHSLSFFCVDIHLHMHACMPACMHTYIHVLWDSCGSWPLELGTKATRPRNGTPTATLYRDLPVFALDNWALYHYKL